MQTAKWSWVARVLVLALAGCADIAMEDEVAVTTAALVVSCANDNQCAAGQACGVQNRAYFENATGQVCWPAQCQSLAYQCGNCGTTSSACGECPALEECDPDIRVAKVRFYNMAANDGSGRTTGTSAAVTKQRLDGPTTAYPFTTADELFATCPVGSEWQLSFESVQTLSVAPSCLETLCASSVEPAMANAKDFLHIVQLNSVSPGKAGAFQVRTSTPPYVVMGNTSTQPYGDTFAHEVGHLLQMGWVNPALNAGSHYPETHPYCTSADPKQEDVMCEERGLMIHADACDYFYNNTVLPTYVRQGSTHGDYVIDGITVQGAPPGNYTFKVASPTSGYVQLYRNGVAVAGQNIWYSWQTAVTTTQVAMIDFPGYLKLLLRSHIGSLNLYNMNASLFDGKRIIRVESPVGELIRPGRKYGYYVVSDIDIKNAPAGSYTFSVSSPTAGSVTLKRNGTAVSTVSYLWRTTVTDTTPAKIVFPGYFDITVRADRGSLNLGALYQSIFDGSRTLQL